MKSQTKSIAENWKMNLIEKLGLEKCKQIVEGAPETATNFLNEKYYEEWSHNGWVVSVNGQWEDCKKPVGLMISLDDLRTAITNHEKCQHEWNESTSNGDVYRFLVCKHCDSTQNYVPFKDDNPSHFDHCTDIRNHISPLTGVIER